jgi:acyl-coenzyme A synthetase/AMP-(fatty) acid ligase/acyl carrier protein
MPDVRVMQATPSTWRMLLEDGWRPKRHLVALCGGEELQEQLAGMLLQSASAVWNLYGPTETTIWSTAESLQPGQPVSLGGAIQDTDLYVLDQRLEPVPIGVSGELYIGGVGVARGYVGRADLTAGSFVPRPYGATGGRLYRTGDMVRWRPDGTLSFIGRIDHLVKIRGFRIELGEIEERLRVVRGVRDAVVVVREGKPGDKRLVAYVTGDSDIPDTGILREHLSRTMPDYMIPGLFVRLAELPLTPSGKIDRRNLPAPKQGYGVDAHASPRTPVERKLRDIWLLVLDLDEVSVNANFFDLGGHSLHLVHVQTLLVESLQRQIPITKLFQYPTIRSLAQYLIQDIDHTDHLSQGRIRGEARRNSVRRRTARK